MTKNRKLFGPFVLFHAFAFIIATTYSSTAEVVVAAFLMINHHHHHHYVSHLRTRNARNSIINGRNDDSSNSSAAAEQPRQEEVVYYDTANTDEDLLQILSLQRQNLPQNISPEEAQSEGFVTIEHDLETLRALNQPHSGHIVARTTTTTTTNTVNDDKDDEDNSYNTNQKKDRIVGYALIMLPHQHRDVVPFLRPIFQEIETMILDEKLVRDLNYCVMGQICIAKDFRGSGIFHGLYQTMAQTMKHTNNYDYIITGVARNNLRSRSAHEKVGFCPLRKKENEKEHTDDDDGEYEHIVLRL